MDLSKDYLKDLAENFGLSLSDDQIQAFEKYKESINEWNKVTDITTITDDKDIYTKHFMDSLTVFRLLKAPLNASVVDIGSGAGFPGIPMKIYDKTVRLTMLDSLNKRVEFLKEITDQLSLSDTEAIHGRAEDIFRKEEFRESFDYAVSRALAPLPTLLEYCLPAVKPGGFFIAMKGPGFEEELKISENALKVLGGQIEKVDSFLLGEDKQERTLLLIKKVSETPTKYPRGLAKPRKKPL